MISFKLKLVVYFLLLSLLPTTAAFIGFTAVTERNETRLVDARLESGLWATVAAYRDELDAAQRRAAALARSTAFQRALTDRDRAALATMLEGRRGVRVAAGEMTLGRPVRPAAERRVAVVAPERRGRVLGVVIASVRLDSALAERLRARSGLDVPDRVVFLRGERVLGARGLEGRLAVRPGMPGDVTLAGKRFRALVAGDRGRDAGVTLAVLTPYAAIDAASAATNGSLLLALMLSLACVALLAYLEGRSLVRSIHRVVEAANEIAGGRLSRRVPVRGHDELALLARSFNDMAAELETRLGELEAERRRLEELTLHFGDVLGATHDSEQLLRTIAETAVKATRAAGGIVHGAGGELVEVGDPHAGSQRIELPLSAGHQAFGTLVLTGDALTGEAVETAGLLAGQAAVALENARLHEIVQRQALVDELTWLPNRRAAERALASEIARVRRFGGSLSLVLADIDDFKAVNDEHGHPAGDVVLRELARAMEDAVREVDVPARWGGEEFAIILPGTDAAGAARVAERVRNGIAERTILTPDGAPLAVTASFGVADYALADSATDLVAAADAALYGAKRAGKDRVATAGEPLARS